MYVMKNPLERSLSAVSLVAKEDTYPSGLARISSVTADVKARLLFLKEGRYGFEVSK